jgi:hypothetical protein
MNVSIESTDTEHWTARDLFDALAELGPLRVISQAGPSTFEAICEVKHFGISDGMLNAMTPQYHWHIDLSGLRHVRTRDEVHVRSGRQVLFFELRSSDEAEPFLFIYLHREKNMPFEEDRMRLFARLHAELGDGVRLERRDAPEEQP